MGKPVRRKRKVNQEIEETVARKPRRKRVLKSREKETSATLTNSELEYKVIKFKQVKDEIKKLQAVEKALRDELEAHMNTLQKDPKGHSLVRVVDAEGDLLSLQRQVRRKISVDEEALAKYLIENEYDDYLVPSKRIKKDVPEEDVINQLVEAESELVEDFVTFEEKRIEKAVMEGEIPAEDFESLCEVKETIVVTFVKEEDEEDKKEEEK